MSRRRKTKDRTEPRWGTWRFTNEVIDPTTKETTTLPGHSVIATNDRYQVRRTELGGGWLHLSIKRRDRRPIRDWRAFQRIKNELAGSEREAVEIYPAESRLHDAANQYHLWVAPPGEQWPLGFEGRSVSDDAYGYPAAVQRRLPAGTPQSPPPADHRVAIRLPRPDAMPSPGAPDADRASAAQHPQA